MKNKIPEKINNPYKKMKPSRNRGEAVSGGFFSALNKAVFFMFQKRIRGISFFTFGNICKTKKSRINQKKYS